MNSKDNKTLQFSIKSCYEFQLDVCLETGINDMNPKQEVA